MRPTLTHEAIAWLVQHREPGQVIVATQNGDGLHELTGVQGNALAALHGSVFTEVCSNPGCRLRYERDFYVCDDKAGRYYEQLLTVKKGAKLGTPPPGTAQCATCHLNHMTGRLCDLCAAPLRDTIVNFGDEVDEDTWERAVKAAEAADVTLVLGSSLQVNPAAELAQVRGKGKKLVICNRQSTSLDDKAHVRIFGDCDQLMAHVMELVLGGPEKFKEWLAHLDKKAPAYDASRRRDDEAQ